MLLMVSMFISELHGVLKVLATTKTCLHFKASKFLHCGKVSLSLIPIGIALAPCTRALAPGAGLGKDSFLDAEQLIEATKIIN